MNAFKQDLDAIALDNDLSATELGRIVAREVIERTGVDVNEHK